MSVVQVDVKTLVTTADLVLYGQVATTRVIDRRKEGRGVWTEFQLDVKEVWKGDLRPTSVTKKTFAWRHVGGTTSDGITVSIPGMPTFVPGEETIVILEKTSDSWVVSGGPQGKFVVRVSPSGQRTVTRELPDVNFVRRNPTTGQPEAAPKPVTILRSLDEMRAEVANYVAAVVKMQSAPAGSAVKSGASTKNVK